MKKILALALALCLVFALAAAASADWAPNGPVTMVVAYKAGNGTDNTARILAKYAEVDGTSSNTFTLQTDLVGAASDNAEIIHIHK